MRPAPEKNPVVRLFERWVPISKSYHGQRFFVRTDGKLHATLLMLVLVIVETTDVIFAVDSIPAIFAITQDSFIVYTSNVFAIRSSSITNIDHSVSGVAWGEVATTWSQPRNARP